MELLEGIKSRKSIRGYKPTPVPKETLAQILEIAACAPSAMNIQPWKLTVLGGKVLDELKKALQEKSLAGEQSHPDFDVITRLAGVYRERQIALAKSLFQLANIAREDKAKRREWDMKMLCFFDAPNAIIISIDEEVSRYFLSTFSLGIVAQNIALAAVNFGLGTCIEQDSVSYPEAVRQIAGMPESQKIAMGIAIGYPDWDFPVNRLETGREPLENIVTWLGV